jgi:ABC-type multidrug transport system ATPase subunit
MTTPLLAVDHIARRFGAVTALADVSFEVMPGEVVALLGDNGAGKSTLIKIIAGTQPPSSGRLLWNGQPVTLNGRPTPRRWASRRSTRTCRWRPTSTWSATSSWAASSPAGSPG